MNRKLTSCSPAGIKGDSTKLWTGFLAAAHQWAPNSSQLLSSGITSLFSSLTQGSFNTRVALLSIKTLSQRSPLVLLFSLFFPTPPSSLFSPHVQALRKSKRIVFVSASYCTYTHTSSNTGCRLIKGATYLLSTHRASHLNRLPGTLDTSNTITELRMFCDNV